MRAWELDFLKILPSWVFFSLSPPNIAHVNMISIHSDPWVLPPIDRIESWGDVMSLNLAELNYIEIVSASA